MSQLYCADYQAAIVADLIADSGFNPATTEARAYVKTNLVDLAAAAAPLFPTVWTSFFPNSLDSSVNKGGDANIDWQDVQTKVALGKA